MAWPFRQAQRVIVAAGCLAMAYTQLTTSPATVEFARSLGASSLQIGILGALPTGTLFMQFVAALVVNHLSHRRGLWLAVSIVQRLAYVPIALGPLYLPGGSPGAWAWGLVAATAFNHALLHFCSPLWLSWMGDYLPHRGLATFWGVRHLWMQWTAAASLLGGALLVYQSGWEMKASFALLTCVGAALGLADVLLFLGVAEPVVTPLPQPTLRRALGAPFRDVKFRSFIAYTCFWHFSAMVGAPFISLYCLDHVGMNLASVLLLWALSWAGGAALSGPIGKLVEDNGPRPVLIICTALKATNMLALLVIPAQPTLAFWILVPVFMFDALLNAGNAIATNAFMLKTFTRENRTMFLAAGTAVAGMAGGVTAVASGAVLDWLGPGTLSIAGFTFVGYHALFAASLVLRLFATVLARRVRKPKSRRTRRVMLELVGVTPLRILRFSLGHRRPERSMPKPPEELPAKRSVAEVVRLWTIHEKTRKSYEYRYV